MTEVLKAHQVFTGKSPSGKANRPLCTNCQGTIHVILGMFPNVHNSKRQLDADSETSVHTNTQQNLLVERKIRHPIAIHFPSNDEGQMQ